MRVKLTILCDNTVGRPIAAVGEHGFACLVETTEGATLFDTGQGLGLAQNARALRKDLSSVRRVVLSHGHYDHVGGLPDLLRITSPLDVHAHPEIFSERLWEGADSTRDIGIPYRRAHLESLGARFCLQTEYTEIAPGLRLSGEIHRTTDFERGDPRMVALAPDGKRLTPDPFRDDLSLFIDSDRGLIVLLGCAHAGLINILRHALAKTGCDSIYAVLGGTHLGSAGDADFESTLEALDSFSIERLGVSHCTGLPRAARLQERYGRRFFFASVGTVLEG